MKILYRASVSHSSSGSPFVFMMCLTYSRIACLSCSAFSSGILHIFSISVSSFFISSSPVVANFFSSSPMCITSASMGSLM